VKTVRQTDRHHHKYVLSDLIKIYWSRQSDDGFRNVCINKCTTWV